MDTRDIYKLVRQFEEEKDDVVNLFDSVDIELNDSFVIETGVIGFMKDGVILHLDEHAEEFLDLNGALFESIQEDSSAEHNPINDENDDLREIKKLAFDSSHNVEEAKYQGREVPLGKPMAGDVKKSKVYVRKPNGKVVKVNFGDKNMRIKKSNPSRRKSFRARHRCENPGPRWKARYWSCRAW